MTSTVLIRLLASEDYDAWSSLWKGYQRFYNVDIAESVTARTFSRLLDSVEPMHCALAERDGTAIGLVHFIFHRSTWTEGNYCYLQDLFVDPASRNTGSGRKLIEHVYDAARRRGASRVYWLTHESNIDAMKLYDKVAERPGFVQYRRAIR